MGGGFGLAFAYYPVATQAVGIGLGLGFGGHAIYDGIKNGWGTCNVFTAVTSLLSVFLIGANLVNESLSGLGEFGVPDEFLPSSMWNEGYYTDVGPIQPQEPVGGGISTNTGGIKEVILGMWDPESTFHRTWMELFARGRKVFPAGLWLEEKLSTVYPTAENFPQAFSEAMTNAKRINFDITELNTTRAMRDGSVFSGNNFVSYEYYQIRTNPAWLAKTTFYKWENGILRGLSENEIELLYPLLP
jgi:hypothetical protein